MCFLLVPNSSSNLVTCYNYQNDYSDVSSYDSSSSSSSVETPPKQTYEQYMERSYDRYMNLPRLSRDMTYSEYMNCMYDLEVPSTVVATETVVSSSAATDVSDDSVVHNSVLLPRLIDQVVTAAGAGVLRVAYLSGRSAIDLLAFAVTWAVVNVTAGVMFKYFEGNLE